MAETEIISKDGTDFAIRKGKLHLKIEWAYRIVVALMLVAYYVQTFWLARNFASKIEMKESIQSLSDLKISILSLQKDISFMGSSTINQDQSRRLDDHENRLRQIEQKVK